MKITPFQLHGTVYSLMAKRLFFSFATTHMVSNKPAKQSRWLLLELGIFSERDVKKLTNQRRENLRHF